MARGWLSSRDRSACFLRCQKPIPPWQPRVLMGLMACLRVERTSRANQDKFVSHKDKYLPSLKRQTKSSPEKPSSFPANLVPKNEQQRQSMTSCPVSEQGVQPNLSASCGYPTKNCPIIRDRSRTCGCPAICDTTPRSIVNSWDSHHWGVPTTTLPALARAAHHRRASQVTNNPLAFSADFHPKWIQFNDMHQSFDRKVSASKVWETSLVIGPMYLVGNNWRKYKKLFWSASLNFAWTKK